jgi:hypothetical protein
VFEEYKRAGTSGIYNPIPPAVMGAVAGALYSVKDKVTDTVHNVQDRLAAMMPAFSSSSGAGCGGGDGGGGGGVGAAPAPSPPDPKTLELYEAAKAGDSALVKKLITDFEGDIDVNWHAPNAYMRTALICVAEKGFAPPLMKLLIDAKADLDATDEYGNSAMHFAAYWGHFALVEMLRQAGADPKIVNEDGETPIDDARRFLRRANDIVTYLQGSTAPSPPPTLPPAEVVEPGKCKLMVSFNDGSAGSDAGVFTNFLTDSGYPTFCTKVYCPGLVGNWRDKCNMAAETCTIYIPLITNGWQLSPECQQETVIIKNRRASRDDVFVKVIPVWYMPISKHESAFDKKYDLGTEGHQYSRIWGSEQGAYYDMKGSWMHDIKRAVEKTLGTPTPTSHG